MSYQYTRSAKHNQRHKVTVLLIGLAVLSGGLLAETHAYGLNHPSIQKPTPAIATPAPVDKASTNYALPVRLQIPKLQVDAQVNYVGLTKKGDMDAPVNVRDTGWYKYGALPGNTGTAVIAGHLDGLGGKPGVFSNLNKLAVGDIITVTESNGLTISFVVRETRSYPQNEQPTEVFNSTDGSHLNLITCTGSWDSSEHRFAKRLVVFADKVL